MKKYIPSEIEEKWQKKWQESGIYRFNPTSLKLRGARKYYNLVEFPYPSGDLHLGHWFTFSPADAFARFKKMQGFSVFFPNGFDAFGLPAENAAIQRGIHPRDWTLGNIKTMTKQFGTMGTMIDWNYKVITCLPEYYKWNQWIFLKMYEKGLVYRGKAMSNWCPSCQTVLANENIEAGHCWRCGTEVIQKEIEQWFLKITKYAEDLLWKDGAEGPGHSRRIDWPKSVREGQNNWIGKSEGIVIDFDGIKVYTTRPETIDGATFLVLSPEYAEVLLRSPGQFDNSSVAQARHTTRLQNGSQWTVQQTSANGSGERVKNMSNVQAPRFNVKVVKEYIERAKKKTEMERKETKDKTGVFAGFYVKNPWTNKKIPVWVADYVIYPYGTGAIMAVPDCDERDKEFAKKYKLPIVKSSLKSRPKGEKVVNYHLRDWSISRQRYWGTPVPMIHCKKCGIVPAPYKDLPVELPYQVDYTPKGKPPLATAKNWLKVKCPKCQGQAVRDPETLDTFFDSSWYLWRYISPSFDKGPFDKSTAKKLMPVDVYFGGGEHTLGHTLYARFFTKFFKDIGLTNLDEFALRRVQHGVILGPDGYRMSKSRGNVVSPDDLVKEYGADCVRLYLCFMIPYAATAPFNVRAISGVYRFLKRVWELQTKIANSKLQIANRDKIIMNKTIKKVTDDLENFRFNTAVASIMSWLNHLSRKKVVAVEEYDTLLKLLAPFAPHFAEELYQRLRAGISNTTIASQSKFQISNSVHLQSWPRYDSKYLKAEQVTVVVQVNGKVKDTVKIQNSKVKDQKSVEEQAQKSSKVQKYLEGNNIRKVIYVEGKIINFVIS